MTDKPNNDNSRLFTDSEVDQLLTAFYPAELPKALDELPSSWPEIMRQAKDDNPSPVVSAVPVAAAPETRPVPTANRGIVVAVATLAACLTLIVVNNIGSQPDNTGTVDGKPQIQPVVSPDATFNVSEGGTDGAIDENRTSLKEIDEIELTPPELPKQKVEEKKE